MSQITIRDIPEIVETEIRRLASEQRISLSKASVVLLGRALGVDLDHERKRDLSAAFGYWDQTEYDEFRQNTRGFDEIDTEIWK